MKTRKPLPTFESFNVDEARASAKSLLQSVIKGETKEIEGIKMSKEMAQGYADWLRMSPYGKKFDTLPFHKLFKASFDWGISRYVDKSLNKELEDLKKVAKTFESVDEQPIEESTEFEDVVSKSFDEWYSKQDKKTRILILNKVFDKTDVTQNRMADQSLKVLHLGGWGVKGIEVAATKLGLYNE